MEEPRLFDMRNVFPVTKYTFNMKTLSWHGRRTFVRVCRPDMYAAHGGMRVCFDVNEVDPADPHSEEILNVAKMYRRNIPDVVEGDFFTEGEMQHLCAEIVRQFNCAPYTGLEKPCHRVQPEMIICSIVAVNREDIPDHLYNSRMGFFSYHTTDSDRVLFAMEPKLVGHFTKYNSNFGKRYSSNEFPLTVPVQRHRRFRVFQAAEALSHFSLIQSGGGLLLCDLQGVEDRLTDPELHTYNQKGMGIGNMGPEGIRRFVEGHVCSKVCRLIGLQPFAYTPGIFYVTDETNRTNPLLRLARRINDPTRPERITEPNPPVRNDQT
ncbi:myosin-heavy-chain kinase [Strigomonas culicis]|uniref:Myosin-heavy-chain kinase n=1 Tax=Strigomonas culicis TaxID=28005 RepID=S9V6G0_9TRYP|nr:myosin-heavy-chain kinase [Strigomonas culicis]|eukprot:EPY36644.1 myosin-heavy-chain kinase [Strigomonas culicis]